MTVLAHVAHFRNPAVVEDPDESATFPKDVTVEVKAVHAANWIALVFAADPGAPEAAAMSAAATLLRAYPV